MKFYVSAISAIFILINCKTFAQESFPTKYQNIFDSELKDWTNSFENLNLNTFTDFTTVEWNNAESVDMESQGWLDFLSLYAPLLSYSNDKKKIIDIYSYDLGLEKRNDSIFSSVAGESTVYLYDLNYHTQTKLFFLGFSSIPQEVVWLSDTTFIITANTRIENKVQPLIYFGNCNARKLYVYTSTDSACCKELYQYFSPKFDKIKIYDR